MTDSVVKLVTAKDQYSAEVVERLERLLAEAKKGGILSICYSFERPDGSFNHGSTNFDDLFRLSGMLGYQQYLLNEALHNNAVDAEIEDGA